MKPVLFMLFQMFVVISTSVRLRTVAAITTASICWDHFAANAITGFR